MKRAILFSIAVLWGTPLFAAYQYYYSDALSSVSSNWTQNGSVSTGSSGFTSATSGSLISTVAVPSPANYYEVEMTLGITMSGGSFSSYLRASTDALSGISGTFYSVTVSPQLSGGSCSAALGVTRTVSNSATQLYYTTVPCRNGSVVRSIYTAIGYIAVYVDNVLYALVSDGAISSGQPGIGAYSAPAGNTISSVSLGGLYTGAPQPVNAQTIATSSVYNRVDCSGKARPRHPGDPE